jgi:hypothetical protein
MLTERLAFKNKGVSHFGNQYGPNQSFCIALNGIILILIAK